MVASIDNDLLSRALLTPRPDLADSDEVLLSLETALALEIQGNLRDAARWLRRAADDAEKQGNDERVLAFARAAADMSFIIEAASDAASATLPPSPPDALDTGTSQYPPTTPPPESFEATIPPVASATPTLAPTLSAAPATISSPTEALITERNMRIGALRVAILESSIRGSTSFFVERLEKGQPLPVGATEGLLVFNSDASDSAE